MYQMIKLLFDIVILKKGPQDIPAEPILLLMLILVNLAINMLASRLSSDWWLSLQQTVVEMLLMLLFAIAVLNLFAKPARFLQTACALMGTDALLTLFALPAIAALMAQGSIIGFVIIVLLILCRWIVIGHILRHALSQSFIFALGIAFLYMLLAYQSMVLLFPEQPVIDQDI